jgi:alpha-L-rhamnosidase
MANEIEIRATQTSYVVALYTRMAPENLEPKLTENLAKDIESRIGHRSTRFLGTPFLLFVLADHGRSDALAAPAHT